METKEGDKMKRISRRERRSWREAIGQIISWSWKDGRGNIVGK